MWFAILGPPLVHDGEAQVNVPKGRQRALFAALVIHAGNTVSADALAEVVWDGSPPSGAAVTLRSHVFRLRRVLGPRAGARLVTRSPGYLLQAGSDKVDVVRFRCLCRDGGAALREGAWVRADGLLGEALDLWRGAPLAGPWRDWRKGAKRSSGWQHQAMIRCQSCDRPPEARAFADGLTVGLAFVGHQPNMVAKHM